MWRYKWYQKTVDWCCKWGWWKKYIWGLSTSYEDFSRNSSEVLRREVFPFGVKDVKAVSVFNLRLGYITHNPYAPVPSGWSVPIGDRKYIWKGKKWTYIDARLWNPFYTKFCNAAFFFQLACCFKNYFPFPFIGTVIRFGSWYFQAGMGHGGEIQPDGKYNATWDWKFVLDHDSGRTRELNPTDVTGYFEGQI
jgi:hypothetical protein